MLIAFMSKKNLTKTHVILLFCVFFSLVSVSQNKIVDSLKNVLKTHQKKDTVIVNTLNYLAFYHYRNDPPKAVEYINESLKLANQLKVTKFTAHTHYIKAVVYTEQANFKVATDNYEKAIQLYTSINDLNGLKKCNNALGVLYAYKGDLDQALFHYKASLKIAEQLGDNTSIDGSLYNIGNIYSDIGENKKALEYFNKALELNTKTKDSLGLLNCYNSIANVYYQQSNFPLAIKFHNKSLEIAERTKDSIGIFQSYINLGNVYRQQFLDDKALNYYNKALAIDKAQYNVRNITALKNNIAGIYSDKKQYDKAIQTFEESIALSKEIENDVNLATALNGLGFVYLESKNRTKALQVFKEAYNINYTNNYSLDLLDSYHGLSQTYLELKDYDLALANTKKLLELSKENNALKHKKIAYLIFSDIYSEKGNYQKALNNYQLFKVYSDSLFNKENIEKITQIEYEYKYKSALDSASLRESKLIKTVQTTTKDLQKSQQNYLLAIIGVLLVSLILGAIIFYQKLKDEKSKTQHAVMQQKLLRSQMTPHFIFNSLSVLQGMILNKEEKKSVKYLSKFSRLLRLTLENSRDKLVVLEQELEAVNDYLTLNNLENNQFTFSLQVDTSLDTSRYKIPPMLIQPFVENAIEHAFKQQKSDKTIDINISIKNNKLQCTIADNGIGINATLGQHNANKNSLATTITSQRLKVISKDMKMDGYVLIEDRQKYNQKGTLVTLVIPYEKI